jgi:hypothetical protein
MIIMKKYSILLILIALLCLSACALLKTQESSPTFTPSETSAFIPKPTLTLTTAPKIRPTGTSESIPISKITPVYTSTPEPKPFLISYTYYSDGGDDLALCLLGHGDPTFILYSDGLLVFRRDRQYWQSTLSKDDIKALFDDLTETGLFLLSENDYSDGNNVLEVNGKSYFFPSVLPESDPLTQALGIIYQYQPEDIIEFVPESLLLAIYQITDLESVETFLPQPTPVVRNWENNPLSEYNEVWNVIRGNDVPIVMAQFNGFPDFQILKKGNTYYIAMICAN